jgi:hypothetical protein
MPLERGDKVRGEVHHASLVSLRILDLPVVRGGPVHAQGLVFEVDVGVSANASPRTEAGFHQRGEQGLVAIVVCSIEAGVSLPLSETQSARLIEFQGGRNPWRRLCLRWCTARSPH